MHPFSTPLKTSENRKVFCFQGVEKGCIGNKCVKLIFFGNTRLYSEPCQISKMERFVRTVNGFKQAFKRCFPVNLAKFLRKPVLQKFCERLLQTINVLTTSFSHKRSITSFVTYELIGNTWVGDTNCTICTLDTITKPLLPSHRKFCDHKCCHQLE